MITGYNTDVKYRTITLHVQTEDKGQSNPCIESLIYYGGQVVAAKRATYDDLLSRGKGTTEITQLMEHQHRTMMKAIKAGKFDDKIRLFVELPDPEPQATGVLETTSTLDLGEETGRTLDQVILEYLTNEAEQEQLLLVLEDEADLRSGSATEIQLRARSSRSGQPISGAKVNVKMISTFGGPRTLGLGETDGDGLLQLAIDIPEVKPGTAALILTATSEIGQAELKQLL